MESCTLALVFLFNIVTQVLGFRYHYRYYSQSYFYYNSKPKENSQPYGYVAGAAFAVIVGAIVFLYFMFKVGCCKNLVYKHRRAQTVCPAGSNSRPTRRSSTLETLSVPREPPPYERQPTHLPSPPAYSYEPPQNVTNPHESPPGGEYYYEPPPDDEYPYDPPPDGAGRDMTSSPASNQPLSPPPPYSETTQP